MNDIIETVDARGLSCPEPVMLADKAIKKLKKGAIRVLVDSGTARDNVSRLGKNSGWAVTVQEEPDHSYRIEFKK